MAGARPLLRSDEFRRERQSSWTRLERLVQSAERTGLQSLTPAEMIRLSALHRSAMSSLSVARTISLDRNLLDYLESLAARSYFCVYGARRGLRATLGSFFRQRFPRLVREFRWQVALSSGFLLLGLLVGFVQTLRDQEHYYSFVGEGMAEGREPTTSTEDLRAVLYGGADSTADALGSFASFLFTHNAQIGILAFALGFAAGLPVFYLLFYNGLSLGAMAALHHGRGLSLDFWGWVLPHGVTELLAIVLCGAGGLVIAQALVLPGRHARLDELAIQGRKAGQLILGSVALLFCAALIEGLFRQTVTSVPVRYAVALGTAGFWTAYFARAGRAGREEWA